MDTTTVLVPKRRPGRPSVEAKAQYEAQLEKFCRYIAKTAKQLDFRPSSRGWAYMLEGARLIDKSEIDAAQNKINEARKRGLLPLGICAEDAKRAWHNVEALDEPDPNDEAARIMRQVDQWISDYHPHSFWDDKPVYIQMVVEKIDLRALFLPICEPWHIPIANAGGWSDLNVCGEMMKRFAENEAEGRRPILLYCGDFDPVGLLISDTLLDNMRELSDAVGWSPDDVIVDRFGLNFDFINATHLTWIDNLQTSGKGQINDLADPRHPHHKRPHVQQYIARYGARKVEANALVTKADAGRRLCRRAIHKYLKDSTAPTGYEMSLATERTRLRAAVHGRFRTFGKSDGRR